MIDDRIKKPSAGKTIAFLHHDEKLRDEAVKQMIPLMPEANIIGLAGKDDLRSFLTKLPFGKKLDVLVSGTGYRKEERENLKLVYSTLGLSTQVGTIILRSVADEVTSRKDKEAIIPKGSQIDKLVAPGFVGRSTSELVEAIEGIFANPPRRG